MIALVLAHVLALREHLSAVPAEPPLAVVYPHVAGQVVLEGEGAPAQVAGMALLAGVDQHVAAKLLLLLETCE